MESSEAAAALSYGWAAVLGLIQGLTEFLPVSSSGHLALAEALGRGETEESTAFIVLLHLATVFVVIVGFHKDIWHYAKNTRIVLLWLVVATIPAGVVGLGLKDQFEVLFHIPLVVSGALLVTAGLLVAADLLEPKDIELRRLGVGRSLVVGLFQALAVTPGISRSGSTIAGGIFCGLGREDAVKFGFILMVPAVLGANLLKAVKEPESFLALPFGPALLGCVVAMVSGYAAMWGVLAVVRQRRLRWFAAYCAVVGVAGLVYFGFFHTA